MLLLVYQLITRHTACRSYRILVLYRNFRASYGFHTHLLYLTVVSKIAELLIIFPLNNAILFFSIISLF